MTFRKLRIAWSVVCGIACVLLIVLWIRSYTWEDRIQENWLRVRWSQTSFLSKQGTVRISVLGPSLGGAIPSTWEKTRIDSPPYRPPDRFGWTWIIEPAKPEFTVLGFGWGYEILGTFVDVPYSFLIVLSATLSAVPWIGWSNRFTTRTLLIATTLVAVVLGLVVWLAR
jgi:hypothetical protein